MHHHRHVMESEQTHISILFMQTSQESNRTLCHPALHLRTELYMIMSLEVRRRREGLFNLPSAAVSSSSLTSLLIALPGLCH